MAVVPATVAGCTFASMLGSSNSVSSFRAQSHQASTVGSHGIAASTAATGAQMMCERSAGGTAALVSYPIAHSRKSRGNCRLELCSVSSSANASANCQRESCSGLNSVASSASEGLPGTRWLKGSYSLRSTIFGSKASTFLEGTSGKALLRKVAGSTTVRCAPPADALVVARLFGPSLFEMEKLRVLFLSPEENHMHPEEAVKERRYTLTHSDMTAQLTLAIAREFNRAQFNSWYKKFHRDEVLAVWRSVNSQVSLHVHCHISGGGNWLHKRIAGFRYYIFRKELPVVIEAFRNGDRPLFDKHPDLEHAPVWVHFHSCLPEFHRRECWGPLTDASKVASAATYADIVSWMYHGEPESWPLPKQPNTVAVEESL